jgi:uncharacterized membrane protein
MTAERKKDLFVYSVALFWGGLACLVTPLVGILVAYIVLRQAEDDERAEKAFAQMLEQIRHNSERERVGDEALEATLRS